MKAIILAAGEGVRLKPLTNTRPKVMLQVAGKPILWHLLHEVKKAGITEVVIVVRYLKEKIIEYFGKPEIQKELGMKIEFVEQSEKNGTGEAILTAEKEIVGKSGGCFVALAGDIVTEASVIKAVIDAHKNESSKTKNKITLAVKKVKNPHLYGVVELNQNGTVRLFEEKTQHPKSDLANLSVYCMDETVFSEIRTIPKSERGEYEIVNIFIGAQAVTVDGFWMDVGYPWHLFEANDYLLSRNDGDTSLGKIENSTIRGKVILEQGAEVFDSYIEGTSYIGAGSKIGPGAILKGNNSIGANCEIGGATTIKNSILFDNVKAKHLSYIGDSIIGSDVNFGSGTQIANFRFDSDNVNVLTERGWVNTGRKKFGTVVGDNTKFGVLACTMPGKLIGENCWISSNVVVNKNIPPNTKVFVKQELHLMKGDEKQETEN
ncbi:MAG: bifunctional sugar-1-phosphate nucleotidylyltransferase/acetyltransferase [Candidatus Micrarchaeota archaeon]